MRKIKVLVIPSWYPSEENSVRGIFFKKQVEALNSYVDIAVLNLELGIKNHLKELFWKKDRIIDEKGIKAFNLLRFNWAYNRIKLKNRIYKKHILEGFNKVLNDFGKPDLIHAHVSYPAGYGAMLISREYGIPFVVTEHASFFKNTLLSDYKIYTEDVLKQADYYIAVSSFLRNMVLSAGRKQCIVLPNFIDLDKFNLTKDEMWRYKDKFNLLNVSLMSRKKGIDILLRALQRVIYDYNLDNIHLHLIGDGPLKGEYQKLAKKLKIEKNCTFYGLLVNDDVVKYMNKADALVISSRIETFGIVGIEAMAAGLPVVSTKCGGPEDYINEENGLLVDREDVKSIADGIVNIINNYKFYDKELIKKFVRENYSKEVICSKLVSIYKNII